MGRALFEHMTNVYWTVKPFELKLGSTRKSLDYMGVTYILAMAA